jgi:vacuolar protein sorting-associated protein 18
LYYKYAPVLLARAPATACESFLSRYTDGLSPLRLLPCIMAYEKQRAERAKALYARDSGDKDGVDSILDVSVDGPKSSMDGFELRIATGIGKTASFIDDSSVSAKYLEGVIKLGCQSSAVFSYLVSLYSKMEDEEPLLKFLTSRLPQTSSSRESILAKQEDDSLTLLDMPFALRTVLSTGRHYRSAIKLYMGFGMRQQAVELALKVDPSLARELAQDSVELDERKRLWLMIAKNAAADSSNRGGKDVVSRVVAVLRDCGPDVLSIEDVLPFL